MQMESTGLWNDVNVTKIGKIRFSDNSVKHITRELSTLAFEAEKSYIHSLMNQMLREDSGLS